MTLRQSEQHTLKSIYVLSYFLYARDFDAVYCKGFHASVVIGLAAAIAGVRIVSHCATGDELEQELGKPIRDIVNDSSQCTDHKSELKEHAGEYSDQHVNELLSKLSAKATSSKPKSVNRSRRPELVPFIVENLVDPLQD